MENVSYYKSFLPKGLKKLFTIMRITVILLFVALFQMVAVESSYSQSATISVKAEQIFLTDLFSQIEHQSEFLFFYVDEEVKNIKVNIQIKNKQIDEVLSQALVGTDLTYTINDRNINITRKTYATQQKQTKHITGKITDVNGEKAGKFGGWDGWQYIVNSVSPNVGVGDYTLSDNDTVVLYYGDYPLIGREKGREAVCSEG